MHVNYSHQIGISLWLLQLEKRLSQHIRRRRLSKICDWRRRSSSQPFLLLVEQPRLNVFDSLCMEETCGSEEKFKYLYKRNVGWSLEISLLNEG